MVKQLIIKLAYKAVEEKMLKIYAISMSIIFLSIWIPAMVAVVKEIIRTFFGV
tara:strand:+ start:300 stop:458 length:159 start_codon:yes stop_codon:yes gene_type:complete